MSLFAIASGLVPSYLIYLACRSTVGFCIGANYAIAICFTAEMVPKQERSFNIFYADMMWTIGSLYVCVAAFFVMDFASGWRIVCFIVAIPPVVTLCLLHLCDESPRYLATTNRIDEARTVLVKMCKENGRMMPEGDIFVREEEKGRYREIFAHPFTKTSLIISTLFFCGEYTFSGFRFLLADMMSQEYCGGPKFETIYIDDSGCSMYTQAEYIYFIVACLCAVPAYIISPLTAEKWGRKPTFIYANFGCLFISVLFLSCFGGHILTIELAAILTLYTIVIANIWLYVPECYPTYIRTTATGVQDGIGKLGGAMGCFLTEYLDTINIRYTICTYIFVTLIGAIVACLIPSETRGEFLVDYRKPSKRKYGILESADDEIEKQQ